LKTFLLALFVLIPLARADGEAKAFVKHLSGDVTAGFYDFDQHEWRWQGATILGATTTGTYLFFRIDDQPLGNSTTSHQLGNGSVGLSRVGTYLPFAWPVGFLVGGLLSEKGSPQRAKAFSVFEELVESIAFTYAVTGALKFAVNRRRPTGENHSFPSGHAALNFAAAGTLAYRYPWYIGAPALAVASAISFSRVDLNQHFASDVVAGAGLGLFFATSVYLNHLASHPRADPPKTGSFTPLILDDTYGMIWTKIL
jgi:membrane-associated phospholipid phosphatase